MELAKPDAVAIEELFFGQNVTTGIGVAQSHGVILLAIRQAGFPVYSYKPMQVKQAVVLRYGLGTGFVQKLREAGFVVYIGDSDHIAITVVVHGGTVSTHKGHCTDGFGGRFLDFLTVGRGVAVVFLPQARRPASMVKAISRVNSFFRLPINILQGAKMFETNTYHTMAVVAK